MENGTAATRTKAEARAAARKLAQVRKLQIRIERLEKFGRGDEDLATQLREQVAQRLVGRCRDCHRTLTDPKSIADGIGPECATKAA